MSSLESLQKTVFCVSLKKKRHEDFGRVNDDRSWISEWTVSWTPRSGAMDSVWFFTVTLWVNLIYSDHSSLLLALNNVLYSLNAVSSPEFFPAACQFCYFQSICSVQGHNLVTSTLWRKDDLACLMASTVVLEYKLIITCWINEIINQGCDRNWCDESDTGRLLMLKRHMVLVINVASWVRYRLVEDWLIYANEPFADFIAEGRENNWIDRESQM